MAVCGTYYVQSLRLTSLILLTAVPVGLLITAILVVNNLRDIMTDRLTGKNTLAVRLGKWGTRIEYVLLLAGSYAFPIFLVISGKVSSLVLLPLLSLPMAVIQGRNICRREGRVLNKGLAGTAQLTLVFCILFSIGLAFS